MAMTDDEIQDAVRVLVYDHLSEYEYLNVSEYVEENYDGDEEVNDADVRKVHAGVIGTLRKFTENL